MQFSRPRDALKSSSGFEASKLVSTEALSPKHYVRHQGIGEEDGSRFFCSPEVKATRPVRRKWVRLQSQKLLEIRGKLHRKYCRTNGRHTAVQFPRVTSMGSLPPKSLGKARRPRRDPAEPPERPRRALGETPAEPSERQISSESLAEDCAPRMVTLRNFRTYCRTNGRRTAVQMGGVLSGFPFFKAGRYSNINGGGCCRTNWRCIAVLSPRPVRVGNHNFFAET